MVRNGICHGLIGISPPEIDKPAMLHFEINDSKHALPLNDLNGSFSWLSRLPRAFSIISNPGLDRLGSRGIDNEENRLWWLNELGLSIAAE